MKAFTTLELIVAMVITGIIVSLSYEAWLLLGQHGRKRSESQESTNSFAVANYLLRRDAALSDSAYADISSVRFYHGSGSTEYFIDDSTFIRTSCDARDQFPIRASSLAGFMDSIPVESGMISLLEIKLLNGETYSYAIDYPAAIRYRIHAAHVQ